MYHTIHNKKISPSEKLLQDSSCVADKHDKQAGLTLLLSIFIMAGLALITITVSSLAVQSIRNSRAVALSEPAIGAAHSGAEEGVWAIKRTSTPVAACDVPSNKSDTLANNLYSARQMCQTYADATLDLASNTPFTFYLYDPAFPNGVPDVTCSSGYLLDLSEMPDGGYSDMTITLPSTATHNLSVYVTDLTGATSKGSPGSYPVPLTVSPGGTLNITSLLGSSGCPYDNRKLVKLVYWLGGITGAEQTKSTVTTNLGMPSFPTINSTGCAQRGAGSSNQCNSGEIFSRRINVTVPQ